MLPARTIASIERFFQFSLLGLVATSCFALAGSGYLDRPALLLTFLGLALRGANIAGFLKLPLSPRIVSLAVIACTAIIPLDFYFLSRSFLTAIVHGVCFLTVIKILTARAGRDYIYTGAISLLALIAAGLLSAQSGFFACLTLYIAFAIAAFTSAEIRSGIRLHAQRTLPPPSARIAWRLAVIACTATAGILLMTAGIFLLVPRTARTAARLLPNAPRLTGFSNQIDLGGFGKIARDTRAVMHIRSTTGPLPVDLKWRGSALSRFDGKRWSEPVRPVRSIEAAPGPAVLADRLQLSRRDGHRLLYHVDIRNADTGTLFLAGIPEFINIDVPVLYETRESAIRVAPQSRETLRYDVSAHFGPPLPQPLTNAERARYLQFPPLDARIVALAREWSGAGSPAVSRPSVSQMDRARRIEQHLQRDFKYKLDGPERPVPDPLADFLFVRKEGYCEYFASAMAIMLRSIGIPSRVATGFQSGYFNDVSGLNVVRASDAHAWVEAWIESKPESPAEGGSWTTFDPTPPASSSPPPALLSRIDMYLDALDNAWRDWVVSYDLSHQVLMAARFEDTLRRFWRAPNAAIRHWPSPVWGVAALVIVFLGPRLWGRLRRKSRIQQIVRKGGSPSDATVLYEQMIQRVARQGIHKPASLTPNEFAATVPELAQFTELYNSIRFGGNASGTSRLALLLMNFKAVNFKAPGRQ